jgi:hypothetical protein
MDDALVEGFWTLCFQVFGGYHNRGIAALATFLSTGLCGGQWKVRKKVRDEFRRDWLGAARKSCAEVHTKCPVGLWRYSSWLLAWPNHMCFVPQVFLLGPSRHFMVQKLFESFWLLQKFLFRAEHVLRNCALIFWFELNLNWLCFEQSTLPFAASWLPLFSNTRIAEELSITGSSLPHRCGECFCASPKCWTLDFNKHLSFLSLFARQLLCVLLVLLSCQCRSTFMCLLFQDPNSSSYFVVARDCDLHPWLRNVMWTIQNLIGWIDHSCAGGCDKAIAWGNKDSLAARL